VLKGGVESYAGLAAETAYKFRLYPNRKQEERMLELLEECSSCWKNAASSGTLP
jgi:hypothetical protein